MPTPQTMLAAAAACSGTGILAKLKAAGVTVKSFEVQSRAIMLFHANRAAAAPP